MPDALAKPFQHITIRSPAAPSRGLPILEPGTIVNALGVFGWTYCLSRVVSDDGDLMNPSRAVELEKLYFGSDGKPVTVDQPDRIKVMRDRLRVREATKGAA